MGPIEKELNQKERQPLWSCCSAGISANDQVNEEKAGDAVFACGCWALPFPLQTGIFRWQMEPKGTSAFFLHKKGTMAKKDC